MRLPRLLAALLLSVLGPSGGEAEPLRPLPRPEASRVLPRAEAGEGVRGHRRRGPGYMVWEETRREADAWAGELAGARRSEPPGDG